MMLSKLRGLFATAPTQNQIVLANPGELPPPHGVLAGKKNKPTKVYSAEHVGGKGANLLKLHALGVNVPAFLIIPAEEFQQALRKASKIAGGATIEQWLSGEDAEAGQKLAQALDQVSVSSECLAVIKSFITADTKRSFAVRSSATMEDGSDSAFAGQFDTVLNCHGEENIVNAIKTCWKSLLSATVLPFYQKHQVSQPEMAVVVQEQVFSTSAGVYFQANPVTGASSTHIINVAFGQGEGVVSGLVQSDEFWLNASTGKVFKRVIGNKTTKVGLQEGGDGTRPGEEVSADQATKPALSDDQIFELYEQVQRLKQAYKSPQDVEFAFHHQDLYILQARPITTRLEQLKPFECKEVGLWRLNAHVSQPMSALYEPIWIEGWSKGCMYNSELVGSGFSAVDACSVNGFGYFCMRTPGPQKPPTSPPPKFMMKLILGLTGGKATKASKQFWTEKLYLKFAAKFDKELKPQWIERHRTLQAKHAAAVTPEQLLDYVNDAHEHMVQAWYAHCTYTLQQMLPAAYFAIKCTQWTGCSVSDAYETLEGFSPVTTGWHGEFPSEVQAMRESLRVNELLANKEGKPASEVLALLKLESAEAKRVLTDVEFRLLSGYDPANSIVKDEPDFLIAALNNAVRAIAEPKTGGEADAKAAALRSKIPAAAQQAEFDAMLAETRSIMKLRDERAIYTDLWAAGILHDAVIRASAVVHCPKDLFVEASIQEIRTCLQEKQISQELLIELAKRKNHRNTCSIRDAPDLIGGVNIEITKDHFPNEWLGRSFAATMVSIAQLATPQDFEAQYQQDQEGQGNNGGLYAIYGLPCSQGEVEGIVRVVKTGEDIAHLQKGEVIVTESPSSLINLVLPFASAIVCDFGATLSHAAVCSRELGLPCIVGTKIGTVKLQTGQRVKVNGTTGKVTILQ